MMGMVNMTSQIQFTHVSELQGLLSHLTISIRDGRLIAILSFCCKESENIPKLCAILTLSSQWVCNPKFMFVPSSDRRFRVEISLD